MKTNNNQNIKYVKFFGIVILLIVIGRWITTRLNSGLAMLTMQSDANNIVKSNQYNTPEEVATKTRPLVVKSAVDVVIDEFDTGRWIETEENVVKAMNALNNKYEVSAACALYSNLMNAKSLKATLQTKLDPEIIIFKGGRYSDLKPVVKENLV